MTLTVALAILAGLVLAALVAHGAWTARRAHPRQPLPSAPAPRVDPDLGDTPVQAEADAHAEPRAAPPRPTARLDALVDAIVPMALEQPLSGEAVLAHRPASRRAGSKPFLIEGLNIDSGEWEPPPPRQRYSELQAGVQLASRSGALNEIEYSEFVHKLQAFADSVGAMPDFPDMLDVVARARELDGFAGPLDAQLTVRLLARSVAWSVGYVQQSAARHGLVPAGVSGRMVLPSAEDGAPPLLVLAFDAQAALAGRRCAGRGAARGHAQPGCAADAGVDGAVSDLAPHRPCAGRGHGRRPHRRCRPADHAARLRLDRQGTGAAVRRAGQP